MNRISKAFENKKAVIAFVTGGDPDLETTEALIPEMAAAGADLIEIGIPFSDPIAEGVLIQEADERALRAGTTTDKLFEMVKRVRNKVNIPLVFVTYMNPVYTYGTERFAKMCAECGIDGVVIPDVPFEEKSEVSGACEKAGIELISIVVPSAKNRLNMIANEAGGFLYCAASNSKISDVEKMIDKIKKISDIPCAVGYSISTPEQAQEATQYSDGAIIKSSIVSLVAKYGKECIAPVCDFVREIKEAVMVNMEVKASA